MKSTEIKSAMRTLKKVYAELEKEANKMGIAVGSPKYDLLMAKVREAALSKMGMTLEEYRMAKAGLEDLSQESKTLLSIFEDSIQELTDKVDMLYNKETVSSSQAEAIAQSIIERTPPQEITNVVKETVVKEPQITKETIIEKYDDTNLRTDIALYKLNQEKKYEDLRKEFETYIAQSFQKNIDIMGMPDFRKLAMGLQAQIDDLSGTGSSGGFNSETPSGTVDDSNVTFTVSHTPSYIIVNGASYLAGTGIFSSYAGGTITLSSPVGTGGFIKSIYA